MIQKVNLDLNQVIIRMMIEMMRVEDERYLVEVSLLQIDLIVRPLYYRSEVVRAVHARLR